MSQIPAALLNRAEMLHREAEKIIADTNVVTLFSRLGSVNFVGSYRLNVMYRPDIDLIVISDKTDRRQAVATTIELLSISEFQTIGFADWFTFALPSATRGFYWELIVPRAGQTWKFDVWWLCPADDHFTQPTRMFENLLLENPLAREPILLLKEALFDGVKYKSGVNGPQIYAAVLQHHVTSMEEFMFWKNSSK